MQLVSFYTIQKNVISRHGELDDKSFQIECGKEISKTMSCSESKLLIDKKTLKHITECMYTYYDSIGKYYPITPSSASPDPATAKWSVMLSGAAATRF